MLGTGAAATLAMAGTQGLVSGFHHCHKGDLLEQLAQHLLAVDGLPIDSGCYGYREGTLCIWQVGGGNNPVVPHRKEAEAAHFLGVAMWYTA